MTSRSKCSSTEVETERGAVRNEFLYLVTDSQLYTCTHTILYIIALPTQIACVTDYGMGVAHAWFESGPGPVVRHYSWHFRVH